MTRFFVTVQQTIETTVEVEAASAQAAVDLVDVRTFPLPARGDWQGVKGHEYIVTGPDGEELSIDVRGCSCGEADFGAPGHDGDPNGGHPSA